MAKCASSTANVVSSAGEAQNPTKPSGRTRIAPPLGTPASFASKLPARSVDNRDEFAPTRTEMVQTTRFAEHNQMMTRAAKTVAGSEATAMHVFQCPCPLCQ